MNERRAVFATKKRVRLKAPVCGRSCDRAFAVPASLISIGPQRSPSRKTRVSAAWANFEFGSIALQSKTSKTGHVLSASCCFQLTLSANGCFHFHFAFNFEISKKGAFCCSCGNRLLPIAAHGWVKSHGRRRRRCNLKQYFAAAATYRFQ